MRLGTATRAPAKRMPLCHVSLTVPQTETMESMVCNAGCSKCAHTTCCQELPWNRCSRQRAKALVIGPTKVILRSGQLSIDAAMHQLSQTRHEPHCCKWHWIWEDRFFKTHISLNFNLKRFHLIPNAHERHLGAAATLYSGPGRGMGSAPGTRCATQSSQRPRS